jgi:ElaB/YqjD/DUF883 family membrane-anchored ribosome-binding protein
MPRSKREESFKEKAEDKMEEIKETYEEYKDNLVGYIQKKPMTALCIAAAAGILIGAFWGAMRSKK